MKKGLLFFTVFFVLTYLAVSSAPTVVKAYTPPVNIRVGLESKYKETDSVPLSNPFIFIGYEINGQFTSFGMIQQSNGFSAKPLYSACVQAPGTYTSYEQALSAAVIYGNTYAPSLNERGEWLIYGTGFQTEDAAWAEAAAIGGVFLGASNKRVALYNGSAVALVFDNTYYNVQIKDAAGGTVKLGASTYRGAIELARYAGKKLTAVNVLSMDEYLYSVVPSEMSASFQPEALKAQAVASRSYTLTRMGVHKELGYDLCDLSHCQNYQGAGKESEVSTRAVNDTYGKAAYYEGQPINAVYFASSGGVTDYSENVWVNAVPYLKGVADINEYEPKVWTRAFTLNELTTLLTQNNCLIGTATGAAITKTGATGRVLELTIYGTAGNKLLSKEEIRTFFNPSAGGMLESRYFSLNGEMPVFSGTININGTQVTVTDGFKVVTSAIASLFGLSSTGTPAALTSASVFDGTSTTIYNPAASAAPVSNAPASAATITNGSIIFSGRGWGHGVGMSQRGAEGLARLGYDYLSILYHYYTGIAVE